MRDWWGRPESWNDGVERDEDGFAIDPNHHETQAEIEAKAFMKLGDALAGKSNLPRIYKDYLPELKETFDILKLKLPIDDLSFTTFDPSENLGAVKFECYFRMIKHVQVMRIGGPVAYRHVTGTAYMYYPEIDRFVARDKTNFEKALHYVLLETAHLIMRKVLQSDEVPDEIKREIDPDFDEKKRRGYFEAKL